jgi:protein-disulfide isomerase
MRILRFSIILLLVACTTEKGSEPIAEIGGEPIYMDAVDSILGKQLNTMRQSALQSLISIKLMKIEAEKQGLNHQQYKEQEIFNKTKTVSWKEVSSYAMRNGIEPQDSNQWKLLKEQRKLSYRKSRHAVLIDSLRRVYEVKELYKPSGDPTASLINQLDGQARGAANPLSELHIVFDYECGHCMVEKDALDAAFNQWGGLVKFNYVYYAPEYSSRGRIADAIGESGNFWTAWPLITSNALSVDELKQVAIENTWISATAKPNNEARFTQNKEALTELGIYSVPTYILNGMVLPPNTSADEVLGYLYAELSNEVEQGEVTYM